MSDAFLHEETARLLDALEVDDDKCPATAGPGCRAALPLEPNRRLIVEALERAAHRGAANALLGEAQGFVHDANGRERAGSYWLRRCANHLLNRAKEHEEKTR